MSSDNYTGRWEKYILLHVLVYSITENFYELCRILTSLQGDSKYKKSSRVSGIRYQECNVSRKLRKLKSSPIFQYPFPLSRVPLKLEGHLYLCTQGSFNNLFLLGDEIFLYQAFWGVVSLSIFTSCTVFDSP